VEENYDELGFDSYGQSRHSRANRASLQNLAPLVAQLSKSRHA
jgi:hypothetical protein